MESQDLQPISQYGNQDWIWIVEGKTCMYGRRERPQRFVIGGTQERSSSGVFGLARDYRLHGLRWFGPKLGLNLAIIKNNKVKIETKINISININTQHLKKHLNMNNNKKK